MVYVASADAAGEFVERQVKLGRVAGREIQVLSGLSAGDSIVVEGSFFLRAEAERLGLRQTAGASGRAGGPASMAGMPDGRDQPATVLVTVTDKGFEPARVSVQAGQPARITFRRTTDDTCATEVVFPSLKIRRALPLHEDVEIELTPAAGEIAFVCGMDMLRGTVVVQ
jgi:plastocyanin